MRGPRLYKSARHSRRRPVAERFWEKVAIGESHECWLWTGAKMYSGYGMFWHDGKARMAHRVPYFLGHGIWAEQETLHSCDNRVCCNPAHLSNGSHVKNMADAVARGRMARGERSGVARLTDEIVRAVRRRRAEGATMREIAAEFNCDSGNISRVINRKIWRHVE